MSDPRSSELRRFHVLLAVLAGLTAAALVISIWTKSGT